jgi:hypothetical protein
MLLITFTITMPYPPIGIAIVSFFGLSSYLMLVGIYFPLLMQIAARAKAANGFH